MASGWSSLIQVLCPSCKISLCMHILLRFNKLSWNQLQSRLWCESCQGDSLVSLLTCSWLGMYVNWRWFTWFHIRTFIAEEIFVGHMGMLSSRCKIQWFCPKVCVFVVKIWHQCGFPLWSGCLNSSQVPHVWKFLATWVTWYRYSRWLLCVLSSFVYLPCYVVGAV